MARYDLHVQTLPAEEQRSSNKIFTLGYSQSLGVKGFQMLINLWLKVFFTRQGSDHTNLARGTNFTNLIGSTTSIAEAEDITRLAIDECNLQVSAIQARDQSLAPRERLATVTLLRFQATPTAPGFDAYLEILNQAGERLDILIPEYAYR